MSTSGTWLGVPYGQTEPGGSSADVPKSETAESSVLPERHPLRKDPKTKARPDPLRSGRALGPVSGEKLMTHIAFVGPSGASVLLLNAPGLDTIDRQRLRKILEMSAAACSRGPEPLILELVQIATARRSSGIMKRTL